MRKLLNNLHKRSFCKLLKYFFISLNLLFCISCSTDKSVNPLSNTSSSLVTSPQELLSSGKRFAVTMWEFSWMTRRFGNEAEYADWDKVLDELVERGYECIRIDAFPHLISKKNATGQYVQEATLEPLADNFMWGNHTRVTVNPREALVEFMQKAKQRGLYIGLSTWFLKDIDNTSEQIDSPEKLMQIWRETLRFLNSKGLLDIVVWVDLCNEFPTWFNISQPMMNQIVKDNCFQSYYSLLLTSEVCVNRDVLQQYIGAIDSLKMEFPQLNFTFSAADMPGISNIYNGMDLSNFGVMEPHIWLATDLLWGTLSNHNATLFGQYPQNVINHYKTASKLYREFLNNGYFKSFLTKRLATWQSIAAKNGKKVPIIVTEAWVSVNYDDLRPYGISDGWGWFKELAEFSLKEAVKYDYQGLPTSNFAEPHFKDTWADKEWHKKMTQIIRSADDVVY